MFNKRLAAGAAAAWLLTAPIAHASCNDVNQQSEWGFGSRARGVPFDALARLEGVRRGFRNSQMDLPCIRLVREPSVRAVFGAISGRAFSFTCPNGASQSWMLADVYPSAWRTARGAGGAVQVSSREPGGEFFGLCFSSLAEATTFVEDLGFLRRRREPQGADASFLNSVASARTVDHAELIRRTQVQAEALIGADQPIAAARLYRDALEQAPEWPSGHYNLAVIYGSLELYSEGITELRRYLALGPSSAENARAVQDQIYRWEALLPPVTGGSPTNPQEHQQWLRDVDEDLTRAVARLAPGYARVDRVTDQIVDIPIAESRDLRFRAPSAGDFAVVVLCGSVCSDVNVEILDANGTRLALDNSPEDYALGRFSTNQPGEFVARASYRGGDEDMAPVFARIVRRNQ